jgi:hypothetical protein
MSRIYWTLALGQVGVLVFIYMYSGECNHLESTTPLINAFSVFWAVAIGILAAFRSLRLRLGVDDTVASKKTLCKLTAVAPLLFFAVCSVMTHDRGGIGCPF